MKSFKLFSLLLIILAMAASCKKDPAPAGPAGTNGNANVKIYSYGHCTFNAENFYEIQFTPNGFTAGLIDSSAIFAYYRHMSLQWNMANGNGPGAQYATIQYTNAYYQQPYLGIYLMNSNGTNYTGTDVTWDSVRIVVIPANLFMKAKQQDLDFRNYNAVYKYCNLK